MFKKNIDISRRTLLAAAVLIISYCSFSSNAIGQIKKQQKSVKITKPFSDKSIELPAYTEEFATFPGGNEAFNKFLKDNISYKKGCAVGKVYANFLINKKGILTDIKIVKGTNPINNKEVIRVLKLSPKWNPAKINSEPIETRFTLPINFSQH